MRLIDADVLKETYKKWLSQLDSPEDESDKDCVKTCIAELEDAPTIEAEPVRHGRWVSAGEFELCPLCQHARMKEIETCYGRVTRFWVKTNFCPNCGAKMDLGDSDDE